MPEITHINQDSITVVGISTEVNSKTDKIADTVRKYFYEFDGKIPNNTNPNITYGIYTNYNTENHAEYTYLVGAQVTAFENIDAGLKNFTIPAQSYAKFATTQDNVSNIWNDILNMQELNRSYITDFEVYNTQDTTLDIYIGINS